MAEREAAKAAEELRPMLEVEKHLEQFLRIE
jgi:hypothetical protein